MGKALSRALYRQGLDVVFGDNLLGLGQMVPAAIEQGIRRSEVTAVMWNHAYAQSAWCYDELSLTLSLEALGIMKIRLFNLDDSPIVHAGARLQAVMSIRNSESLKNTISELLK